MKIIYAPSAESDLENILDYTTVHFPGQANSVEERIRSVIARIADWPLIARLVEDEPGIRVVPVLRYPFLIFIALRRT